MDHSRAGFTEDQCPNASVPEQVEHIRVDSAFAHPVPLRRHVWKKAEMAKWRQRGVETDGPTRQLPLARHGPVLDPASAAFFIRAGDEGRIGIPTVARGCPHRLRFRPDDLDGPIALKLPAIPAVDKTPVHP